jgi:predicted acylesterase/phospholipase RssA
MRIGVALGGGGARGWAHIGVLRTLIKAGLEPDVIAGTSSGAIVGGAYAAGRLDELEAFARSIDRRSIWRLVDVNLGKGGGLVTGERVANKLTEIIGTHQIENLKKKFAAVATELPAGHEVWLETGDLIKAMRASYAMPGIFVPSPNEGRPLIDGGIANPVPVSACRAMGANVVIAVPLPASHTPAERFARQTPEAELSAWKKATAAYHGLGLGRRAQYPPRPYDPRAPGERSAGCHGHLRDRPDCPLGIRSCGGGHRHWRRRNRADPPGNRGFGAGITTSPPRVNQSPERRFCGASNSATLRPPIDPKTRRQDACGP